MAKTRNTNKNEKMINTEEYVTLSEASEKSGCSKKKIQKLAENRKIQFVSCEENLNAFGKWQKLYARRRRLQLQHI